MSDIKNCDKCGKEIHVKIYNKTGGVCYTCRRENREVNKINEEKQLNEKMLNTPGCPSCDGSNDNYLPWPIDSNPYMYKPYYEKYPKYIKLLKKHDNTEVYTCSNCKKLWYWNELHQNISLVTEKYFDEFMKFANSELKPAELQKKLLEKFDFADINNEKYIPCEVKLKKEDDYRLAIYKFTKNPINDFLGDNIYFPDDVEFVKKSDYSVSSTVMKKSFQSSEFAMGFAPMKVKGENGKTYILANAAFFFDLDDLKGKDIKFVSHSFDPKDDSGIEIYHQPFERIIWIYCNK